MLLIPAIDLKNGQCVRLKQGRMEDATIFGDDPVAFAAQWVEQGAQRLHLVDLDGAVEGSPKNHAAVHAICKAFPNLPIQIGGGIRNETIAAKYFDAGIHSVIIGTQAVREPEFVARLCQKFPDQVIVGIDAKDGWVATHGWLEVSNLAASTLARQFANMGVSAIVYTDIARDGMLQGVNVEATANLARDCGIPVIASGGVTDVGDIERLWAVRDSGICGVIIGRALYDGRLSLAEAQKIVTQ